MTNDTNPDVLDPISGFRIVIVGPCASGKTTLAANLQTLGFDAHVSGQEHSEIRSLWKRLDPHMVVALHIDLDTLRQRRGPTWSELIYDAQQRRLAESYAAANIHLDTALLDESEVLQVVLNLARSQTGPQ